MNAVAAARAEPLIEIRNLTIRYREGERQITAVRDVSFALKRGGSLAIVGESGSGKSSVAGAILDFLGPEAEISGAILFEARTSPASRRRSVGEYSGGGSALCFRIHLRRSTRRCASAGRSPSRWCSISGCRSPRR
jgi:ABC-type glutathione transport system ATPase component